MTSLKSYAPKLAKLLATTPAALYERQRALVRAGLLEQSEGRGPGSGVRITAASAALMLIAAMATDNLSEVEDRVREIASARSTKRPCKLTGKRSLHDAMAAILASKEMATRVVRVAVSRTSASATIAYTMSGTARTQIVSEFSGNVLAEAAIRVVASIDGTILRVIAEDVAQALSDEADSSAVDKKNAG